MHNVQDNAYPKDDSQCETVVLYLGNRGEGLVALLHALLALRQALLLQVPLAGQDVLDGHGGA